VIPYFKFFDFLTRESVVVFNSRTQRKGEYVDQQGRRFGILMDYENFEKNVEEGEWIRDFSWLTQPILERGVIIIACVFFPDHLTGRIPLQTLANMHRFFPIACPRVSRRRGAGDFGVKDTDTVDARMDQFGKFVIDQTYITDLVVVTGDGGFQELLKFAEHRGKGVSLISAADAVSGRFIIQERQFNLKLV